jgi:hypothetical protein
MANHSESLADVLATLGTLSPEERALALKMFTIGCSVESVIAAIKRDRGSQPLGELDAPPGADTPHERQRG